MIRKTLSAALSLALVLAAPGLPASSAFAANVGQPQVVRVIAIPAAPWRGVVTGLAEHLNLSAEGASSPLARVLGHARVEMQVSDFSPGQVAFLRHVDPRWTASREGFQEFVGLRAETQAAILEAAVEKTSAELNAVASELLAKAPNGFSGRDAAMIVALSQAWFYLDPALARDIRGYAEVLRASRTIGLGERLARSLVGSSAKEDTDFTAARAELGFLFQGVERLAALMPEGEAERKAFTGQVLAPYMERALASAGGRMNERGYSRVDLLGRVLKDHRSVFGALAPRSLVRAMRASGQWTDFVAAMSLAAAQGLLAEGVPTPGATRALQGAGADYELQLAVPEWHALAAPERTVAGWIAEQAGAPPVVAPRGGIPLFTLFGIPVRAQASFLLIVGLVAFQLQGGYFPRMAPGLPASVYMMQGLVSAALLYASIVAHEFGHALTGRPFGVGTRMITLHILGGMAAIDREPRRPMAEFLIAVAGPLVSLALGVLFLGLAALTQGVPGINPVFHYVSLINFFVAVFNMIPAFPMDGGRVLRSVLAFLLKDHYKATRVATAIGRFFGGGFMALGLASIVLGNPGGIMQILLGFFISSYARAGARHPGTELVEKK